MRPLAADGAGNVVVVGQGGSGAATFGITTRLDATTGAITWQQTFAGAAGKASANAVALDAAGNAYVVGSTTTSATNVDVQVVKYAANGSMSWSKTFDAGTSDVAYAVAVDPSGNVVVGAESLNASGNVDIKVLELAAATGTLTWQQTIDGGNDDFVSDLAIDASGNVLVAGVSMNASNSDIRVAKLNGSTGAIAWNVAIDNGAADEGYAIAVDASGNAFVTGSSVIGGATSAIVAKLSAASGSTMWTRTFAGSGQGIAVDAKATRSLRRKSRARAATTCGP